MDNNNFMYKVSVIMPTYNRLGFLKKAIESFKNQDYDNAELLVLDNACTDGSTEYLSGLNHHKIKVIHRTVNNPIDWLNFLWNHADGDLICQLHDDDELTTDSISLRVNAFESNEFLEVCYAGWFTQDKDGDRTGLFFGEAPNPYRIINKEYINFTTMMWKNSIKSKFMFEEALIFYADWHFKIRCAMECCMTAVKEPVMKYTVHGGSASNRCRALGQNAPEEQLMRKQIKDIYGIN